MDWLVYVIAFCIIGSMAVVYNYLSHISLKPYLDLSFNEIKISTALQNKSLHIESKDDIEKMKYCLFHFNVKRSLIKDFINLDMSRAIHIYFINNQGINLRVTVINNHRFIVTEYDHTIKQFKYNLAHNFRLHDQLLEMIVERLQEQNQLQRP